MNDRRTQSSLTDIVGRTDIGTMQADKQAIPVFDIPFAQPLGIFLLERAFEQPGADPLKALNLSLELRRRQSISVIMHMYRLAEQGLHRVGPKSSRVEVHHRLKIA